MPTDIFNVDKTGLFFWTIPEKVVCLKSETCVGRKLFKEQLIELLCATRWKKEITTFHLSIFSNFTKLLNFSIGKAHRPWCFKGLDINSFQSADHLTENNHGWLNIHWIKKLNRYTKTKNKKCCCLLGNTDSHPYDIISLTTQKLHVFHKHHCHIITPRSRTDKVF